MKFRTVCCALLAVSLCMSCSRGPKKANVLLITIDTVRQDHLGCYGYEKGKTPVLDGLAREGVLFENAYCQVPITLPSHASILTGLYPPRHGLRLNGSYFLPEGIRTLPGILKEHRYNTAAFISSFVLDSQFGLDRGFDVYDDEFFGGPRANNPERPAEETAAVTIRWLKEEAQAPFFLWLHFFDPHMPYLPPEPYATEFKDSPYDGEIAYMDYWIGEVLKTLNERGWGRSTLVVVLADHGEGLGEHDELTHSFFIYDTTIKVPLLMRLPDAGLANAPAKWIPGSRVREMAQTVDLVPTILHLLGIEEDLVTDGANLVMAPMMEGERVGYAESLYPLSFGWSPLYSARMPMWKYIDAPNPELYNTDDDPGETRNTYSTKSRIARDLDGWLYNFLAKIEPVGKDTTAVDPEMLSKLRSLGYLGSSTASSGDVDTSNLPDPKDRVKLFDKINEARALRTEGKYDAALKLLKPYRKQEKDDPVFLQTLGQIYEGQSEFRKAIEYYERFRDLDPDNLEAWGQLASMYLAVGEAKQALPLVQHAVETMDTYAAGWDMIGVGYGMLGNGAKAIAGGQRAVQLEPANPDYRKNYGVSLMNNGMLKEADEQFRIAIDLQQGESADLYYHRALALHQQGRFPEALKLYRQVLELDPDHASAKQVVDEVDGN